MEIFQGRDSSVSQRDPHGFFGPAGRALGALVGPRIKWVVVALAIAVSAAAFIFAGAGQVAPGQVSLPDSAESSQAAALKAMLPASGVNPAILVVSRQGGRLSEADIAAVTAARDRGVAAVKQAGAAPSADTSAAGDDAQTGSGPAAAQVSEDGSTALAIVPLSAEVPDETTGTAVDALRTAVRKGLPDGLTANVTGGPAFTTDIGAVFDGADITLLGSTAVVVAILLLITYRSPWLWLVPLGVVGVGDQVASKALDALSRFTDVSADGAVKGITSVLVFGAGTNYALLVIARYREELRRTEDRHEAMRHALASAAPAILASSSTVILALLSLGLADDTFVVSLGYAGALGIAIALAYALLVLPATLVLFGRRLFWPFVPRVGSDDPSHRGLWQRVGEVVTRRPSAVGALAVVLLAVLASGGIGLKVGQTPNEQFLAKPEASGADARYTAYDVILKADPGSEQAFDQVRALRETVTGTGAKVGGADAQLLDSRTTAARDRAVLFPVIMAIVLTVLLLLLRSVVAAVLLVATVVATYVVSMGASWFAFSHLFGYPPLADSTPLLAFLFLVALGVDYNIFLTTRAREEASSGAPARTAIVRALAVTGGVITSAGILLAAVFAVLGVLPLVQLAQIGVIVGFGVLLDTLVVRSVLVPALVALLGERFWWPGHPAGR